jgi:hypothetical protein
MPGMRSVSFPILLLLLAACGGEKGFTVASDPVSVRGWITDVKGAKRGETIEMEIARRTELFTASSVWVENQELASGGIAENGSFVVLDVPPQNAVLGFNAPGAETAKIVLQNIPGNADVLIPNIILEPNGTKVLDPAQIKVRVPASVERARDSGRTATVAGYTVRIIETPLNELMDRRDYPNPPGYRPVATVR